MEEEDGMEEVHSSVIREEETVAKKRCMVGGSLCLISFIKVESLISSVTLATLKVAQVHTHTTSELESRKVLNLLKNLTNRDFLA